MKGDSQGGEGDPNAFLTSGGLHVASYLLRLLDTFRPEDPLTFLHAILHRSSGGMSLDTSILLEFLQQATRVPLPSLLETLRLSMSADVVTDPRDALWRQVTFAATRSLQQFTHSCSLSEEGAAALTAAAARASHSSGKAGGAAGVSAGVPGILKPDCLLPSFTSLYQQDAPWSLLFAHNCATSQLLMSSICGCRLPAGCGLPAAANNNSNKGIGTKLHIVIEIDADEPSSHDLFIRRADSANGKELLQLVVEEISQLLPTSGTHGTAGDSTKANAAAAEDDALFEGGGNLTCTLDVVLVTTTSGIRNQQSPAQLLYRLVKGLVEAYRSALPGQDEFQERGEGGGDLRASMPQKPKFLSQIRVHLADGEQYIFPVLQALFDAPSGVDAQSNPSGGSSSYSGPTIDVFANSSSSGAARSQQHQLVSWIRDATSHTEILLQLGHILYPFVTTTATADSTVTNNNATTSLPLNTSANAWIGLLDMQHVLVADATATKRILAAKPSTMGTTVTRSVLRYANASRADLLHAQLLRQSIGLSFGGTVDVVVTDGVLTPSPPSAAASSAALSQASSFNHHQQHSAASDNKSNSAQTSCVSRSFPSHSPVILLKLGGGDSAATTGRAILSMATALRRDMRQLTPPPSSSEFLGRLLAFASALSPTQQQQPSADGGLDGGVSAALRSPRAAGLSGLLTLQDGVVVIGGGVMRINHSSSYASSPTHASLLSALRDAVYVFDYVRGGATDSSDGTPASPHSAASGAAGGAVDWRDVVGVYVNNPSLLYETLANHDILIAPCISAIAAQTDRNFTENSMLKLLPRAGVLSRVFHNAGEGVDEEDGSPCTVVKSYVQTLSPKYLVDCSAASNNNTVNHNATLAEEIEAAIAAAASLTSQAAAAPPPVVEKKKR